jgi:hypothetical protein
MGNANLHAAFPEIIRKSGGPKTMRKSQTLAGLAQTPVAIAYFYKVKWGFQDEFIELFKKNHYPILEAQLKSGRLLSIEMYTPRFHGDGRGDWTFMTVLGYKNWQTIADNRESTKLVKQLYPDQRLFKREEQRRFELLEAHWDMPLRPVAAK